MLDLVARRSIVLYIRVGVVDLHGAHVPLLRCSDLSREPLLEYGHAQGARGHGLAVQDHRVPNTNEFVVVLDGNSLGVVVDLGQDVPSAW